MMSVSNLRSTGLPPVFKDLSMKIKAGEKIGVVGRTGSGKSSMVRPHGLLISLSHTRACQKPSMLCVEYPPFAPCVDDTAVSTDGGE